MCRARAVSPAVACSGARDVDPTIAQPIIEQFVIAFPTAAAWLIVILMACLCAGAAFSGRWFLHRWNEQQANHDSRINELAIAFKEGMEAQRASIEGIRTLISSEIEELRGMYHVLDRRLVRVESQLRFLGGRPMQPDTDDTD